MSGLPSVSVMITVLPSQLQDEDCFSVSHDGDINTLASDWSNNVNTDL